MRFALCLQIARLSRIVIPKPPKNSKKLKTTSQFKISEKVIFYGPFTPAFFPTIAIAINPYMCLY